METTATGDVNLEFNDTWWKFQAFLAPVLRGYFVLKGVLGYRLCGLRNTLFPGYYLSVFSVEAVCGPSNDGSSSPSK
jgi:hypothetical protein